MTRKRFMRAVRSAIAAALRRIAGHIDPIPEFYEDLMGEK